MKAKMLSVEDLMSRAVIFVHETDLVARLDEAMGVAEIRHLPVVNEGARVVGLLSQRDLVRALGARGGKKRRVSEVMTRDVRTVEPTIPAADAARLMLNHKFGCLPVVGDDEQIVGIITETDFLRLAEQALLGEPLGRGEAEPC